MKAPANLQDLVTMAIRRHGLSGRQLAFKAQEHGFDLAVTTINHIKSGTYKYQPKPETIRALAWLAGVPEADAFTAAGQKVPGPPLADDLPPGSDTLSPKSRKAIIEMARVLIDLEAQANGTETYSEPANLDAVRERRHGQAIGSGQKTPDPELTPPAFEDLAAHPYFKLQAEKNDEYFDGLGEENQAGPDEH